MAIVKDFWAEPTYAQLLLAMQKRVHDYVVADKGTAKEALDGLVKDWTKVFKEDGKRSAVARAIVSGNVSPDLRPGRLPGRTRCSEDAAADE